MSGSEPNDEDSTLQLNVLLGLPHLIRLARGKRGMNVYEAADWFGITQPAYTRWERGKNRPDEDRFDLVAEWLRVVDPTMTRTRVAALKAGLGKETLTSDEGMAVLRDLTLRMDRIEQRQDRRDELDAKREELMEEMYAMIRSMVADQRMWMEFRSDAPPTGGSARPSDD